MLAPAVLQLIVTEVVSSNGVLPEIVGAVTVGVSEPPLELDPPFVLFEPFVFEPEPLLEPLFTSMVVPSGLIVVVVPFSATMMMTVESPPLALRVMVSGQAPVRNTS